MKTLQALRYMAGMSQSDLAERTSIHQPTISNYERGLTVTTDHAALIIKLLKDSIGSKFPETVTGAEQLSEEWKN